MDCNATKEGRDRSIKKQQQAISYKGNSELVSHIKPCTCHFKYSEIWTKIAEVFTRGKDSLFRALQNIKSTLMKGVADEILGRLRMKWITN